MTIRILVTGSRTWISREIILGDFLELRADLHRKHFDPGDVVLVSGKCPKGADAIAEDMALKMGWQLEVHPADWDQHGKRAGYVRNAEMVALGADRCYAYIMNGSKGATMTADLAEKKGIQVWRRELWSA